MPFVYQTGPAANVTTSGSANTEVDHIRTSTGSARVAMIQGLYLIGKGAGLTAISGIVARMYRYATASTAGTTITPRPRAPAAPAADLAASTGPTAGSTPTLQVAAGCGAAGPGGWVARDEDSKIQLQAGGGANGNLDMLSASGSTSLNFEYSLEHAE
jgi:hypothetical protein